MATSSSAAAASAPVVTAPSSSISTLSGGSSSGGSGAPLINANAAQFREIHKNTWLKRLTAEGKKITVGPKVSGYTHILLIKKIITYVCIYAVAPKRLILYNIRRKVFT